MERSGVARIKNLWGDTAGLISRDITPSSVPMVFMVFSRDSWGL